MQRPFKPELHPEFRYQAYSVGQSQTPLLVIDNFIQDAQSLVDYCVANRQFDQADRYYPGQRMPGPELYIQALYFYLAKLFSAVFDMAPDSIAGGKSLYSLVTISPEQLAAKQCLPHIDSFLSGDLACVHYLCDKEKGGTSFYRHKKTGLEVITEASIDTYNQAVMDEGALDLVQRRYMDGSNDFYDRIVKIDAQFNRLVVYPSNILHSGNIPADFDFNLDPARGRLTLNSFVFSKRDLR